MELQNGNIEQYTNITEQIDDRKNQIQSDQIDPRDVSRSKTKRKRTGIFTKADLLRNYTLYYCIT